MNFPASSYRQGFIGVGLVAGLLAAVVLAVVNAARASAPQHMFFFGLGALVGLCLLAILLYWTVTILSTAYVLDRNGLRIRWGSSRLTVPIGAMRDIVPLTGVDESLQVACARRPAWLCGISGRVRLQEKRWAYLRSTQPPARSLAVLTDDNMYVVSPANPEEFVKAWQVRRPLGPTHRWKEREERTWLPGLPIWHDALAWGLVGGAVVTQLVVNGYLAFVYTQLPQALAFHFDAQGRPDRIDNRAEITRLPLLAFAMLALDLALGFAIYRNHRIAAYLVWGGGLMLQLLTWGALLTIAG